MEGDEEESGNSPDALLLFGSKECLLREKTQSRIYRLSIMSMLISLNLRVYCFCDTVLLHTVFLEAL